MAPFLPELGTAGAALVNLALGIGFGFVLEQAGFGNCNKLAAQFYLKDQSVLKVMFTAIITAMVLLFWSGALGILDFDRVTLNETYLWPGIIGGLLLGVGFIIGGYCPGTSVVSAATLKLDGLTFLIGCLAGILLFGHTIQWFQGFWEEAGHAGRLTLPQWLGLGNGIVVFLVVLMALAMFAGAELLERLLRRSDQGEEEPTGEPANRPTGDTANCQIENQKSKIKNPPRLLSPSALTFAGILTALAASLAVYGHLMPDPKQVQLRQQAQAMLQSRQRHIDCAELLDIMHNNQMQLLILDARDEADYNLFHLVDSRRLPQDPTSAPWLQRLPDDSIKVIVSNDERRAEAAWKQLMIAGVPHAYILAGGINHWLDVYGGHHHPATRPSIAPFGDDTLRHSFALALGARARGADPDPSHSPQYPFLRKVQPPKPLAKMSGGCGG